MIDFIFVTGNMDKVHWVEKFLGQKIEHHKLDLDEIQDLDPAKVLEHKAIEAYRIIQRPVLVEDTSLVFKALGQLPGPLIKFFLEELGNDGLCRLLDGYEDRSAIATITFGYYDGTEFKPFSAELFGKISPIPKGEFGHGWDGIFIREGQSKTNAEMTETEYAQNSARKVAILKFATYMKSIDS
jgi:non-canonical purine NTP pyrophosphatase (RdgB/HAM1 family)